MKALLLLLISLTSINLLASEDIFTGTYRDKLFDQEDREACLRKLETIVDRAQHLKINIVRSECSKVEDKLRPELVYNFGVGENIAIEKIQLPEGENCSSLLEKAHTQFKKSKLDEFSSFCEENQMNLSYLRNGSWLYRFDLKIKFDTQLNCMNYLKDLEGSFHKETQPIISFCRNKNQNSFVPSLVYESKENSVHEITGRQVEKTSECLKDTEALAKRFASLGLSVAKVACQKTVVASGLRESIVYTRPMTTFVSLEPGKRHQTKRECFEALEKEIAQYDARGMKSVYGFCEKFHTYGHYMNKLFYIRSTF